MKKKIILLGLIASLGLFLPASASPHVRHHNGHINHHAHMHACHQVHHHPSITFGFSSGYGYYPRQYYNQFLYSPSIIIPSVSPMVYRSCPSPCFVDYAPNVMFNFRI